MKLASELPNFSEIPVENLKISFSVVAYNARLRMAAESCGAKISSVKKKTL